MTDNFKSIFKNFSFSFASNIVSLLISTIVIAIVPKLIGVTDYGYYQLYVFYASYIGFFHIGWCDGIYLKYGGIEYKDYDKPLMSSQFWYLTAFELLVTCILFGAVFLFNFDTDKTFILLLTTFSIVFVIPKTMLSYLLQISNRIKEYSFVIVVEKVIYCSLTLTILMLGFKDYKLIIVMDLIGKVISLLLGIYYCKDIVFTKMSSIKLSLKEAWNNINIGIKLLVANIAGLLILGIVRMAIESQWSIEVFGKISLAISISNLLMVFINAVGTVLFPILKRIEQDRLNQIYSNMRDLLMIVLFSMLIGYYPLQWILSMWLPKYSDSFTYMCILFPMCIYESKMSMLINTYLKALRKEKQLLFVNCLMVIMSGILTYLCAYILKSINFTIILIVVLFAVRCIICEVILGNFLDQTFTTDIIVEIFMCLIFMVLSSQLNTMLACFLYVICYAGYLVFKRKTILQIKSKIIKFIKRD